MLLRTGVQMIMTMAWSPDIQMQGNFSLFLISGDGFFGYAKKENGKWVTPIAWTRSNAIKTGNTTNALKVVSNGKALSFYVNGTEVGNSMTKIQPQAKLDFVGRVIRKWRSSSQI